MLREAKKLTSSEWHEKTEVKKGDYAEMIVDEYLRGKGIIPYFPDFDGAHPFDRLCATQNKRYMCIVDVKAKARRSFYPDTGINKKAFDEYKFIQDKYAIDVWLFFVDEGERSIYGHKLDTLNEFRLIENGKKTLTYPLLQVNKNRTTEIYFPLACMKTIHTLTDKDVAILKNHSTRNYDYHGVANA